jgi:hypothetical protein
MIPDTAQRVNAASGLDRRRQHFTAKDGKTGAAAKIPAPILAPGAGPLLDTAAAGHPLLGASLNLISESSRKLFERDSLVREAHWSSVPIGDKRT